MTQKKRSRIGWIGEEYFKKGLGKVYIVFVERKKDIWCLNKPRRVRITIEEL